MEFFIWAHRGASADAPENTLVAFAAAEAAGADGIELDVHLSRDGVPVVIHDERVERTTDGHGAVAELRLAELRRLDAGSWFAPRFAGEPIPLLDEILDWADDRLRLNIEIKDARAGRALLDRLPHYPRARVLVSSFNHRLLENLRRIEPRLPLGFLFEEDGWHRVLRRTLACGAESLHPREDRVSRPLLAACKRQGLAVYPWTLDEPSRIRALRRLGIDGLFTNDPLAVVRRPN
jgi:glycerophosphoryl diester phosphodiesterase